SLTCPRYESRSMRSGEFVGSEGPSRTCLQRSGEAADNDCCSDVRARCLRTSGTTAKVCATSSRLCPRPRAAEASHMRDSTPEYMKRTTRCASRKTCGGGFGGNREK